MVDLLVLAPRKPKEVDQTLEHLGQEIRSLFGNRLEPLVLAISKAELAKGAKAGKRLWRRILENGEKNVVEYFSGRATAKEAKEELVRADRFVSWAKGFVE